MSPELKLIWNVFAANIEFELTDFVLPDLLSSYTWELVSFHLKHQFQALCWKKQKRKPIITLHKLDWEQETLTWMSPNCFSSSCKGTKRLQWVTGNNIVPVQSTGTAVNVLHFLLLAIEVQGPPSSLRVRHNQIPTGFLLLCYWWICSLEGNEHRGGKQWGHNFPVETQEWSLTSIQMGR